MEEIIRKIYHKAKILGSCSMFTGNEHTLDDIVRLFTDPQGIEFCVKKRFPTIEMYRAFKPWYAEGRKYGIFIDAGTIILNNPKLAVIIGNTEATITCDAPDQLHKVVALQGAKVKVIARNWAVVRVINDDTAEAFKSAHNNAIIL